MRDSAEDRLAAAEQLADYKNVSSVAVLVDALLNDANERVRIRAAKSLEEINDSIAYEALRRSAEYDSEKDVRQAAASAAESIESASTEDELYLSPYTPPMNYGQTKIVEYLEDLRFGNAKTRKHAADKLDNHRGSQTVAALVNAIVNDPDKSVRKTAADSLGEIGDRMALPYLQFAKYNDPDKSVRREADDAIEDIYNTIQ